MKLNFPNYKVGTNEMNFVILLFNTKNTTYVNRLCVLVFRLVKKTIFTLCLYVNI